MGVEVAAVGGSIGAGEGSEIVVGAGVDDGVSEDEESGDEGEGRWRGRRRAGGGDEDTGRGAAAAFLERGGGEEEEEEEEEEGGERLAPFRCSFDWVLGRPETKRAVRWFA